MLHTLSPQRKCWRVVGPNAGVAGRDVGRGATAPGTQSGCGRGDARGAHPTPCRRDLWVCRWSARRCGRSLVERTDETVKDTIWRHLFIRGLAIVEYSRVTIERNEPRYGESVPIGCSKVAALYPRLSQWFPRAKTRHLRTDCHSTFRTKKSKYTLNNVDWISQFTLPHCQHPPASGLQQGRMLLVPHPSPREFGPPILQVGLGQTCNRAVWVRMPMPETAVDEDRCTVAWQHQVRHARQVTPMQTKPVSEAVHHRTDG